MEYDLLLRLFDYHTELFQKGTICKEYYFAIEKEYLKRKKLFTINLN